MALLYPDSLPDGAVDLWIEIAASTAAGRITNKAVTALAARGLTAVTPSLTVYSPTVVALQATAAGRDVTSATPALTGSVGVLQTTAPRALTSVTPAVLAIQPVALTTTAAARLVTSVTPAVATTSGSIAVSDNFNRANGAIGANWATPTGMTTFKIQSSVAVPNTGTSAANYWVGNDFTGTPNQYAECDCSSAAGGPAVRMSSSAETMYLCRFEPFDDGIDTWDTYSLIKIVAGVETQLGSTWGAFVSLLNTNPIAKIEVTGTTITVKTAATHGGTFTTRITQTDSAISSGSPGIENKTSTRQVDTFYAGSL